MPSLTAIATNRKLSLGSSSYLVSVCCDIECGASSLTKKRKSAPDAWGAIKRIKKNRNLPSKCKGMTHIQFVIKHILTMHKACFLFINIREDLLIASNVILIWSFIIVPDTTCFLPRWLWACENSRKWNYFRKHTRKYFSQKLAFGNHARECCFWIIIS